MQGADGVFKRAEDGAVDEAVNRPLTPVCAEESAVFGCSCRFGSSMDKEPPPQRLRIVKNRRGALKAVTRTSRMKLRRRPLAPRSSGKLFRRGIAAVFFAPAIFAPAIRAPPAWASLGRADEQERVGAVRERAGGDQLAVVDEQHACHRLSCIDAGRAAERDGEVVNVAVRMGLCRAAEAAAARTAAHQRAACAQRDARRSIDRIQRARRALIGARDVGQIRRLLVDGAIGAGEAGVADGARSRRDGAGEIALRGIDGRDGAVDHGARAEKVVLRVRRVELAAGGRCRALHDAEAARDAVRPDEVIRARIEDDAGHAVVAAVHARIEALGIRYRRRCRRRRRRYVLIAPAAVAACAQPCR